MIDILYFASLREMIGSEREQLEVNEQPDDIAGLKQMLAGRGGVWEEVFTQQAELLVSVNHEMANDQTNTPNTYQ